MNSLMPLNGYCYGKAFQATSALPERPSFGSPHVAERGKRTLANDTQFCCCLRMCANKKSSCARLPSHAFHNCGDEAHWFTPATGMGTHPCFCGWLADPHIPSMTATPETC